MLRGHFRNLEPGRRGARKVPGKMPWGVLYSVLQPFFGGEKKINIEQN